MMKGFNLRMPPELLEELKKLARQNERSVAGELRALVKEKLRSSKPRKVEKYDQKGQRRA